MKLLVPSAACFLVGASAFTPAARSFVRSSSTARSLGVDPSSFADFPHHINSLQDAFTSFNLADAVADVSTTAPVDAVADSLPAAVADVQAAAVDAVADVQAAAADTVNDAATNNGWFGFLTAPIGGILQTIHTALVTVGLSANAWGISIIGMTVLIKLATYPLTKTQLESTVKMQAMQPAIKELQAKYQSNPEVMNQKIAEFYQANEINPLAGCLPSLAQIPIFIGLYRSVLELAKENKLDEPFLWLPNLEGPTYGADPTSGSDWILKGWHDGVPSLGWEDTTAFLILPVLLVISQFVSMELMSTKSDDPSQQQSNAILKVLPLMIGWFSLNVPAALCVYWFANNIITTATSVIIRNSVKAGEPVVPGASAAAATAPPPQAAIFTPPREKPSGFGDASPMVSDADIKTITAVDAEIVDDQSSGVATEEAPEAVTAPAKKKRGGKKGRKKKN